MLRPTCENGIWKGPKTDLPKNYFNLSEKVFRGFKEFPEIIGQIDAKTEEKETFATMGEKAIRCALWLKKQGIKSGDVLGFCSGNHLDSCIPLVASFYVGAIFNPWWDTCLDEDLVKYFITVTEPKVLFVAEELADIVIKAAKNTNHKTKIIVFGKKSGFDSFKDILKLVKVEEVDRFQCRKITNPHEPVLILYTSGTTGNPKGALHTYDTLSRIGNFDSKLILQNTINIWFSGICWISGIFTIINSILSKSTMIICHDVSEEEACKIIEKYKVSWVNVGTSLAGRLSKTKAALECDMSSIIRASYGGGVAKKEIVEFLQKAFKNALLICAYGCTEIGIGMSGLVNLNKAISCGTVSPNCEVKLIKPETGEIVGPNEEGEIYFRGPTIMSGYWKNPKATKEAIDSDGWYHTGDLAYYDKDGDFFIVERIKELIKYRLHHIPPAELENVIQDHPAVAEVGVVAKPNIEDLEQPMAFITTLPGFQVTEQEIHELVQNKLHNRFKLRGGICFLDKMPRTSSGKIAKKELRANAKKLAES